jgi:hypothetical protein
MTITTHMNPSEARAKCDHAETLDDCGALDVTAFYDFDCIWEDADSSVGLLAGWWVTARLVGCQIGNLVLGEDDAHNALDGYGMDRVTRMVEAECEERMDLDGKDAA